MILILTKRVQTAFIMREDSLWTYAAICAWRDAVEKAGLEPEPEKLPDIKVRKRVTVRMPGRSPGKRLLTF